MSLVKMRTVPSLLCDRPLDKRGFPIPFVTWFDGDGKPDFKTIHPDRWRVCVDERRCALCGNPIPPHAAVWFIGGPKCFQSHLFLDPGMHLGCAEYARDVCPYLALTAVTYGDPGDRKVIELMSDEKPEVLYLAATWRYTTVEVSGTELILAGPWHHSEEWKPQDRRSRV